MYQDTSVVIHAYDPGLYVKEAVRLVAVTTGSVVLGGPIFIQRDGLSFVNTIVVYSICCGSSTFVDI